MRDDQRGAALHESLQRLDDCRLGLGLDRAGRLVECQQRRVGQQRPRHSQPLLLAARKLDSTFANNRIVAVGQRAQEIVSIRGARSRLDLSAGCVLPPVAQIVERRGIEQERFLLHLADLRAQRCQCDAAQVVAVDQHAALVGVVEPRH